MYSCPKQSKPLDASKTTAIAIFGCQGSKMLVRWEKPSSSYFMSSSFSFWSKLCFFRNPQTLKGKCELWPDLPERQIPTPHTPKGGNSATMLQKSLSTPYPEIIQVLQGILSLLLLGQLFCSPRNRTGRAISLTSSTLQPWTQQGWSLENKVQSCNKYLPTMVKQDKK